MNLTLRLKLLVSLYELDLRSKKRASRRSFFINISMRLYEFSTPLKTFMAKVKLKNGSTVTATERTDSLNSARMIFHHMFGDKNVFSVAEVKDIVIDEGTKTLSSQELQVKSLADKAEDYKQQEKALKARQQMAKAQQNLMKASRPKPSI